MDGAARSWFDSHTFQAARFSTAELIAAKRRSGQSVSVVIPARNEAATVAAVVSQVRNLQVSGLVDELVVLDSDSTDDTAAVALAAGASVFAARDIHTGTPDSPGKGEALWKSLFVTRGDLLVFIDADLTEWGPHFVTGLLGPLLSQERVLLVKGFYDRLADDLPGEPVAAVPQGGRVTELVARPLINLYWPELAAVVQPLAGEWAVRRSLIESVPIPVGYGVEFASLTDTWSRHGLQAIAQVDLGRRGHRHQNVHDLGVMAAEILATAMRRLPLSDLGPAIEPGAPSLQQYDRGAPGGWRSRPVPVAERPAARTNQHYPQRTAIRCSS
jgi:glucosyl-3-phosphoglycerate synthase